MTDENNTEHIHHQVVHNVAGGGGGEPPKKKGKKKYLFILILIVVIIAVFFVIKKGYFSKFFNSSNNSESYDSKANQELYKKVHLGDSAKPYDGDFDPSKGFSSIVQYAMPAVVNVSATRLIREPHIDFKFPLNMVNPLLKKFFKRFEPNQKLETAISLGSGFIVRSDGFVVTNNHVIKGAKDIKVITQSGQTYEAKLYAVDPSTDLAVLKVNATNLPSLKFDNSDKIKVGDWVIAIGNPFGLGGTVSSGIVSARERNINIGLYDQFIQTDAAINKGNSGGPMIDTRGRVIGVNTAIFSTDRGGSIGIGFAIPSNVVKNVVSQLILNKTVVRGWLGVQIQPINDDIAKILNLPNNKGALVGDVTQGGPADLAGVKVGDVIIGVNNIPITNSKFLPRIISQFKPNDHVELKVISNGEEKVINTTIQKLPTKIQKSINGSDNEQRAKENSTLNSYAVKDYTFKEFGFKAADINKEVSNIFSLPSDAKGVIMTAIEDNSIAASYGLRAGLIIVSVNNKPINNLQDLKDILDDKSVIDDNFLFLIRDPIQKIQMFMVINRGDSVN